MFRQKKLSDFEPVLNIVLRMMAKNTRFRCRPGLQQILKENPRLIVALSHSTPLSWLPSAGLLALNACARGGEERIPLGVMDHAFFQIPLVKSLAQFFTQSERPVTFQDLCVRFQSADPFDLVLFPEGSNCFFGSPSEIQDFRSPKFVELAVRTKTPILIGAHLGSEAWAKALPVKEDVMDYLTLLPNFAYNFVEKRIRKTGHFVLPVLPKPMEKFEMLCELYHPTLKAEELVEDASARREQLEVEATRIRERMTELLDELKEESKSGEDAEPGSRRETPSGELRAVAHEKKTFEVRLNSSYPQT